LPDQSGGV